MTNRPAPPSTAKPLIYRWRFGVVLAAALLLAVAQPLLAGLLDEQGSFEVFFSVLIIAVLLMVFEERRLRRTAFSISLAALLGIWVGHAIGGSMGRGCLVAAYLLAACFYAFAMYGILRAIFVQQVSGDAILGTVCGYLLLGIIWSLLYYAVETAFPGSFHLPPPRDAEAATSRLDRGSLSYYSFITLATVGYGDVTPVTPLARTLAWIEAIAGQFYLAVLVAGLVGFKTTQAIKDRLN